MAEDGLRKIWLTLSPDGKERALRDLAQAFKTSVAAAPFADVIARALNFRPSTIRRAPPDRLTRLVSQGLPRLPEPALVQLLAVMYQEVRSDLLCDVYNALGVPHDGAKLGEDAETADINSEAAARAIEALRDKWPPEDLWLCVTTMAFCCPDAWREAIAAIMVGLRGPLSGSTHDSIPGTTPEGDHSTTVDSSPVLESPSFTTIDRTVIRAIVGALNGVEGSLSWDSLDDLIQELVELNAERHQSRFHRGFLDAILEQGPAPQDPGENAPRRAWYLVGHLFGSMRCHRDMNVLEAFHAMPAGDQSALLDSRYAAGAMLAEEILRSVLDGGDLAEAVRWIEAHGERIAGRVAIEVLRWSSDALLETRSTVDIRRVLNAAIRQTERRTRTQGAPGDDAPGLARLHRSLLRRSATTLRIAGRHTEASTVVSALLETCDDSDERSRLLDQKTLIELGIRTLEDFELPSAGDAESLLVRIKDMEALLVEAASGTRPSPVALFALALPIVTDPGADEERRAGAVGRLGQAIDLMIDRQEPVWEQTGIMGRARFYRAILALRSPRLGEAALAADSLLQLFQEGIPLPAGMTLDAVETVALLDIPQAAQLALLALDRYRHRALRMIDIEELSRRSAPFRRAIVELLSKASDDLSVNERWRAWLGVLRGSRSADQRDLETAEQALDGLETLAFRAGRQEVFLQLLLETDLWDPFWTLSERDDAAFRMHRDLGQLDQAASFLVRLGHLAIGEGQLDDAQQLIDMLDALRPEPDAIQALQARLNLAVETAAVKSRAAEPALSDQRVFIFFVGGNEVQKSYTSGLRARLRELYPNVVIEFSFPGWSSNWGRDLETISTEIERSDAVVLMRFVRTHLGRAVRRLASRHEKPWIACTGHGFDSMKRAIVRAIQVAVRQSSSG